MLALGAVVVGVIPLVKGIMLAEVTPVNATVWVVAVGLGVAVEFAGLSTLLFIALERTFHRNERGRQRLKFRREGIREGGEAGGTYLSSTWTTPFATITSLIITIALFTNTFLPTTSTLTMPPCAVVKLMLPSMPAYPTVPFTMWYSSTLRNMVWSAWRAGRADPILSNAALEGAKIVMSLRLSTVETREVVVRAPARPVKPLSTAAREGILFEY